MVFRRWLLTFVGMSTVLLLLCTENPVSEKQKVVAPKTVAEVDSLFNVLVERVESMDRLDSAESYESGRTIIISTDFASLSSEFKAAVTANPNDVKANVGYIVSSVMSLNKSPSMLKLADSIDAYFEGVDEYYYSPVVEGSASETLLKKTGQSAPGLVAKSFLSGGAQGMGKALLVKAPELLMATNMAQAPQFPRFITMNYIQNIIEDEIIVVLDGIVEALTRLENVSDMSLTFIADGEQVEVDKSDVYIFDAGIRGLRGWLKMLTAYDMDLFTSETDKSYSWIDKVMKADDDYTYVHTITYWVANDTLYTEDKYSNNPADLIFSKIFRDNLKRPSFLTIRKANHSAAYQDLVAVPALIKKGIVSLRAEDPNDQQYDLIPQSVLLEDIDQELLATRQDMIEEGITPALANRFQTPELLMGLLEEVLSGPFTFNEKLNGGDVEVNIKVDISAYFKNPIQDLRTVMPKYRLLEDAELMQTQVSQRVEDVYSVPIRVYMSSYSGSSVYINNIDKAYISSESKGTYSTTITLQSGVVNKVNRNVSANVVPFVFVDNAGNDISWESIEEQIENETYFPYFNDYTFNGVFPTMTRQKWIDLIWQ